MYLDHGDTPEQVTHFVSDTTHKLYCLRFECHTADLRGATGGARDYDDEDCHGSYLTCECCGDYVFPDAAAESDAEHDAIMRQVEREYRAARPLRITRDDLDAYEPGDPKRLYLETLL